MAYKFQLGAARLSGSITAEDGLNTNALGGDGGEDFDISLKDNSGTALEIKEGSTAYLTFKTTNSSEHMEAGKGLVLSGSNSVMFGGFDSSIAGADDGESINVDGNTRIRLQSGGSTVGLVSATGVDVTGQLSASLGLSGSTLTLGGTAVTSTAAELNALDGFADAGYDASADSVVFFDATDSKLKRDSANDFTTAIGGNGLLSTNGVLAIQRNAGENGVTSFGLNSNGLFLSSSVAGAGLNLESGALVLNLNGLTAAAVDVSADSIAIVDANDSNGSRKESIADLATAMAGDGLSASGGAFAVSVDDSSIETNSDALRVKAGGITNDMLAGSIVASKMNNAIFADLETLGAASSDGEFIVATGAGAFAYESGNTARTSLGLGTGNDVTFTTGSFTGDLTVSGDLQVNGSLVSLDVTNLRISDKLIEVASGSANDAALDGGGIQFNSGEGNKSLIFQATGDNLSSSENFNVATGKVFKVNNTEVLSADGAVKVQSAVAGNGLAHSSGVLALDFNELTAAAVSVANDSIAIIDADDSNGTKKESIADLVTAMAGAGITATNGVLSTAAGAVSAIDNLGTGSVGINYWADLDGAETMVLPASPSVGDVVKVKAPSNCNDTNTITISPLTGAHSIDGAGSIVLESPHAAVELVYVAANLWKVF